MVKRISPKSRAKLGLKRGTVPVAQKPPPTRGGASKGAGKTVPPPTRLPAEEVRRRDGSPTEGQPPSTRHLVTAADVHVDGGGEIRRRRARQQSPTPSVNTDESLVEGEDDDDDDGHVRHHRLSTSPTKRPRGDGTVGAGAGKRTGAGPTTTNSHSSSVVEDGKGDGRTATATAPNRTTGTRSGVIGNSDLASGARLGPTDDIEDLDPGTEIRVDPSGPGLGRDTDVDFGVSVEERVMVEVRREVSQMQQQMQQQLLRAQQQMQQQLSALTSSMVDLTRQVGGALRPGEQLIGSQPVEGQSLGGQPSTGSHSEEEPGRAGSTSGGQSFRADPASRGQSVRVDLVNSGSVNGGPVTSGSFSHGLGSVGGQSGGQPVNQTGVESVRGEMARGATSDGGGTTRSAQSSTGGAAPAPVSSTQSTTQVASDLNAQPRSDYPGNGYLVKLAPYDGETTEWEIFQGLVKSCQRNNGWPDAVMKTHIEQKLRGKAARVLMTPGSDDWTLTQLMDALRERLGNEGQAPRYRDLLRSRRRKKGESLPDLYTDILKLGSFAYPGSKDEAVEEMVVDAFCNSLADEDLENKVRDREPQNVGMAFKIAVRIEARTKSKRTRQEESKTFALEAEEEEYSSQARHEEVSSTSEAGVESRLYALEDRLKQLQQTSAPKRDVVCFGCGQPGHIKSNCPKGDDLVSATTRLGSKIQCFRCGENGHIARYCTSEKILSQNPAPQPAHNSVCVTSALKSSTCCIVALLPGVCGRCEFLLDTGSERNILPVSYCKSVSLTPVSAHLTTVSGAEMPVLGQKDLMLEVSGIPIPVTFWVVEGIETGILGMEFMTRCMSMWDMRRGEVEIMGRRVPLVSRMATGVVHCSVLTAGRRRSPSMLEMPTVTSPAQEMSRVDKSDVRHPTSGPSCQHALQPTSPAGTVPGRRRWRRRRAPRRVNHQPRNSTGPTSRSDSAQGHRGSMWSRAGQTGNSCGCSAWKVRQASDLARGVSERLQWQPQWNVGGARCTLV